MAKVEAPAEKATTKCSVCKGSGIVVPEEDPMTCPKCGGSGLVK